MLRSFDISFPWKAVPFKPLKLLDVGHSLCYAAAAADADDSARAVSIGARAEGSSAGRRWLSDAALSAAVRLPAGRRLLGRVPVRRQTEAHRE